MQRRFQGALFGLTTVEYGIGESPIRTRLIVVIVRVIAVDLFKILLRCAAQGAHPVCGQILEIGAFINAVVGIAYLGTVLITAQLASIYAHSSISFHMVIVIF